MSLPAISIWVFAVWIVAILPYCRHLIPVLIRLFFNKQWIPSHKKWESERDWLAFAGQIISSDCLWPPPAWMYPSWKALWRKWNIFTSLTSALAGSSRMVPCMRPYSRSLWIWAGFLCWGLPGLLMHPCVLPTLLIIDGWISLQGSGAYREG